MSLVTLFKFNRNLFVNLKFSKCNIHSMLQIYKDNSETNIGRNIKVQIGLDSCSEKDEK